MSNEWRTERLSNLGRIVTGKTPSTAEPLNWGGKIPFVTPSDMNGDHIIAETGRHLSELGAKSVRNCMIPAGSVMVSCIGSDMGKAALAAHPCVTNQQINSIIVASGDDARFVYYNLSSRKDEIHASAGGSAQPILNKTDFGFLEIELPPPDEQRAIARILGALDDQIELNQRMNRTLQKLAEALFRSWFVDFDPVVAKAAEREPSNLAPKVAALFPAAFTDSSFGPIPQGWRSSTVGDECRLIMGQSPPGESYNEIGEGIPFYQGRRDYGERFPTERVFCTAPTRYAQAGDTLVSVRAPVGDVNMALTDCAIGRGLAAVRHHSGATAYTFQLMLSLTDAFANFEGAGTVFGSINGVDFRRLRVVAPEAQVVTAFEKIAAPFDAQIAHNEHESRTLAVLRDTLLPKLLSGEIRIGKSEMDLVN